MKYRAKRAKKEEIQHFGHKNPWLIYTQIAFIKAKTNLFGAAKRPSFLYNNFQPNYWGGSRRPCRPVVYAPEKGGVTLPNGKLEFNLNLFFKHHFHNDQQKIDTYLDFNYKSSEIELKIAEAAKLHQQRNLKFITLTDPGKNQFFYFLTFLSGTQ